MNTLLEVGLGAAERVLGSRFLLAVLLPVLVAAGASGGVALAATGSTPGDALRAWQRYSASGQLLAALCEKSGLGNKGERYRNAALLEMRNLGDRRATAELLLTDTPSKPALIVQHHEAAKELTKEIGWTEGYERAKRKSSPPDVKPES